MVKEVSTRKTTAFMAFCSEKRPALFQSGKSIGEAGKILGEKWNALSQSERESWTVKAQEFDKIKQEKIASGEYKIKEPKTRANKVPKGEKKKRLPTTSAYMQFCNAKRSSMVKAHPEYKATEVMKQLGMAWKEATAEEKEHFQKIADEKNAKIRAAHS